MKVIAIDGPAAAGKSTVAQMVSRKLNAPYINTGNMYRAATWYLMSRGIEPESLTDDIAAANLAEMNLEYLSQGGGFAIFINGREVESELRSPEVAAEVSKVAAVPFVRHWLVEKQRALAADEMLVMEGRDIGTVVFPDAEFKFFVTASPEVRARRRLAQDGEVPAGATVASVARQIAARDRMDSQRTVSPLRRAGDAELIDTSDMTIDEVVDVIVSSVLRKMKG